MLCSTTVLICHWNTAHEVDPLSLGGCAMSSATSAVSSGFSGRLHACHAGGTGFDSFGYVSHLGHVRQSTWTKSPATSASCILNLHHVVSISEWNSSRNSFFASVIYQQRFWVCALRGICNSSCVSSIFAPSSMWRLCPLVNRHQDIFLPSFNGFFKFIPNGSYCSLHLSWLPFISFWLVLILVHISTG